MNDIAVAKNLRAAGFSQEQAEVLAESISDGIADGAATKLDLARLENKVDAGFAEQRAHNKATWGGILVIIGIVLAHFLKDL